MKTTLSCGSCHACCVAIGIARGMPENPVDGDFLRQHWHEIPRSEAEAHNPNHAEWPATAQFYRCDALRGGKCSEYAERPQVCRAHPYYDRGVVDLATLADYVGRYHNPSEYGPRCRLLPEIIPVRQL